LNKFIKKILWFFLIVIFVVCSLHISLDLVLKSEKSCNSTWTNLFIGNISTDIVIIGNSRAEAHYNPDVISKITGLECYNLGLSGTPINTYNIRWNTYINRNKLPKIAIIDVDYNFLGTTNGLYEKFQYLPYVNEVEYQNAVKEFDNDVFLDQYCPLYKYRGNFNPLIASIKSFFFNDCKTIINGFKVNRSDWDEDEWNTFKSKRINEVVDEKTFFKNYEKGFNQLDDLLKFCKQNKIEAYMFWSPQYKEVQKFKESQRIYVDSLLRVIANNYNFEYINYSNDKIVYNKSNFYNHSHLNFKGANTFSKSIGNYIKNDFLK
jgi:hypothetical protein